MGNTTISWTHTITPGGIALPGYTFNPFIGCSQISPGCANCYAKRMNERFNWNPYGWGPNVPRIKTSDKYWEQPYAWDRKAEKLGVMLKVFGNSLCDVGDDHKSIDPEWLRRYAWVVKENSHLMWMWLTKRPENFYNLWMPAFDWELPDNLAVGVTVENQEYVWRTNFALFVPAKHFFISAEPLLGPVKFGLAGLENFGVCVDLVVVGGESGPKARYFDPAWAVDILEQCKDNNVPFYFKQVGGNKKIDGVWGGDLLNGTIYHGRPRWEK